MLNIIETKRLYLRPADNGTDLEDYLHHLSDADEWLFQYAEEYSEKLYGMIDFTSHRVLCYAVCGKETGQMLGYVGLMPETTDASANLEFYISKNIADRDMRRKQSGRLSRNSTEARCSASTAKP